MTVLLQNQFYQNWFQRLSSHDGAPCQWLLAVLAKLNQLFGERILSLYNKTEWLPRSPDLTPVIFYLLGYLKDQVFRTPPESLNVVRQRITTECNLLRENKDLIRRSAQYIRSREIRVMLKRICKDFIKKLLFCSCYYSSVFLFVSRIFK